jgi:hypothetical protein
MSRKWRVVMIVVGLALIFVIVDLVMLALRVHPISEVADEADRLHLKLIAESVYEYRAMKGRWPTMAEELEITSLPLKAPQDVTLVKNGPYVVVWPQDLDPEPKKNPRRLLVYTLGGPARLGWVWICWGDFRTEYVSREQFETILQGADQK